MLYTLLTNRLTNVNAQTKLIIDISLRKDIFNDASCMRAQVTRLDNQ